MGHSAPASCALQPPKRAAPLSDVIKAEAWIVDLAAPLFA